jgi:hypothetical protein
MVYLTVALADCPADADYCYQIILPHADIMPVAFGILAGIAVWLVIRWLANMAPG